MSKTDDPQTRAAALLAEAAQLTLRASEALGSGDLAAADALEVRADEMRRRARATISRASHAPRGSQGRLSAREQAVTALAEMGVPSPPREIDDFHQARFGISLDVRALASVRRDEFAAWNRDPSSRAAFLAPALDIRFFRPVRGPMTLSSWELDQRILGPSSPRVDHLRLTCRLAKLAARLDGESGQALAAMASRYAQTVPGAVEHAQLGDPERILEAAARELAVLVPQDQEERDAAAGRAREQLQEAEILWGRDVESRGLKVVGQP